MWLPPAFSFSFSSDQACAHMRLGRLDYIYLGDRFILK